MDLITNILYWLSTGLLIPVIVLLIMFFFRALFMGGSFYGHYSARKRIDPLLKENLKNKAFEKLQADLKTENVAGQIEFQKTIFEIINSQNKEAYVKKLVGDYEISADKELGKSKLLTKLGPMLGLMGTLIPMGPALVGLSTGDIDTMAHNMQVAFATTVVGIFISAVGFITLQVKQRWFADDLNTLDYIVSCSIGNKMLK